MAVSADCNLLVIVSKKDLLPNRYGKCALIIAIESRINTGKRRKLMPNKYAIMFKGKLLGSDGEWHDYLSIHDDETIYDSEEDAEANFPHYGCTAIQIGGSDGRLA